MNEKFFELIKTLFPPAGKGLKPYEWMIKATPQKEWIAEKGIFLWLAFFFSEIGAGLYFVSLFYQYRTGLVLGWLITLILGGVVHMAYLGNPKRAWRIFLKPGKSELSKGVWVIAVFSLLGFIQIVTGAFNPVFNFITGIVCLLIIMHGFATMNVIKALPSWSSTMVLPLSIISGIWVGSQILEFMFCVSGSGAAAGLEIWSEFLLFGYIALILLYLWGTFHASESARFSVNLLLKGDMSKGFYVGVAVSGMLIPILLTLIMWGGEVNTGLVFLRLVFVLAGDLIMRYTLMKSAVYTPLI
ncbi:MAG: DMSO reductase [Thermodesulfobacteriota bacterium]|nr:DMSO reductase [Thermodesulfobacteriota bacterium]